jgi:hypothetical protein
MLIILTEKVPYQSPQDNIPNDMYDIILHLAQYADLMSNLPLSALVCVFLFWIEQLLK